MTTFIKTTFVTAAMLMTIPVIAQQKEKEVIKEKKEKKEVEQVIITNRTDEKMTIVIDGDKITINGKDAKDSKDGEVIIRKHRSMDMPMVRSFGNGNFNFNEDNFSFYNVDENKAMLGVITERVAEGAKINEVNKETAAHKAGLKEGDIITQVGDKKISDPDELSKAIQSHKPGDKVSIAYIRDKKTQKADVELGKWKGVRMNAYGFAPGQEMEFKRWEEMAPRLRTMPGISGELFNWNASMGKPRLGVSVQDTEDGKGVKIIEVDAEGNAGKAGLKQGDIITEIDSKKVNSADEVSKLVRENKDNTSMMFKLNRDGKTHHVEVKMPRKLKTADL